MAHSDGWDRFEDTEGRAAKPAAGSMLGITPSRIGRINRFRINFG